MLHTSDWHLGRNFGQLSLAVDQAAFVEWLLDVVREERVDLVVIAGDLFDRAIPPVDSVALLRHALTSLVAARVKVVAIAGNHDSADRVAAADGLTDAAGVVIRGGYERAGEPVTLDFDDGPLDVFAVPYLDPLMAPEPTLAARPASRRLAASGQLELFSEGAADGRDVRHPPARVTHQSVLKQALARRRAGARRTIAVAHAFVAGCYESESERALAVGSSARVATTTFDGFDYVALGHLHRPQVVGEGWRRYSGSPLPYSFSERHGKQVVLVELDPAGACRTTEIAIPVGRPVVTLTGTIDDLLSSSRHADHEEHFVRAVLTDHDHVVDAKARLLRRFNYVAEIVLQPSSGAGEVTVAAARRSRLHPVDAAAAFWRDVTRRAPDDQELRLLRQLLDEAAMAEATA